MAKVEIYKIKKTAPQHIQDYSVFDYMRNDEKPNPLHYVREWSGEMHGTLPLTIPGRLMLEPPEGYQGGDIKNGDIAVVNGTPYFMDKLSGSKFVEVEFDAAAVRDAVHVKYGWFVDIRGAVAISDTLSYVCDDLGIPVGYLGEQNRGGVYNDNRPFLPGSSVGDHLRFLHPDFMKGEEARAFTSLLSELTESERWEEIFDYLREHYPVNQQDLEAAREQYAPELLMPEVLRPLSKVIPIDSDKLEVEYLAAKLGGMDEEHRNIFHAIIEGGLYTGTGGISELINIAENLDCYDLKLVFDASHYGMLRLEGDYDVCAAAIQRFEKSSDPDECFLAKYIALLNRCVEDEAYGNHAAKEEGGVFTKYGLIIQNRAVDEKYHGVQDIPHEYRTTVPTFVTETGNSLVKVTNTDLSALLMQMHALGGNLMSDVKNNIKTLGGGSPDFIIMMNKHLLIVAPTDEVFKDTFAHGAWKHMSSESDISAYIMAVTGREDGRVVGSLYEVEPTALRDYIRDFSVSAADPAAEAQLTKIVDTLRWAVEANRTEIPAAKFLSQISEAYMAQSHEPQPRRFRVAPEAARDIVAKNAAEVFKFYPEPFTNLQPLDATKPGLWTDEKNEFSIRHADWEKLEKWAQRGAGEIMKRTERGEHKKFRDAEL